MLFDLQKGLQALKRPGIATDLPRLVNSAAPFYLPSAFQVRAPLTIYWSINSVCNLRCKMCDVGMFNEEGMFYKNLRIDRKLHEIDIGVFKRVTDEVAADKPFMAFNSTEPLMYKPLGEAVAYCAEHGLGSAVTTGAYTLPQRAAELAEAGLTRLNVSIDGPEDIHNYIRGRDDSFARSIEGIRAYADACSARGRGPEIYVNCTITNMNYDRLVDLHEAMALLPIKTLAFSFMWFIDEQTAEEQNARFGELYPVTASCYSEFIDPGAVDTDVLWGQMRALARRPRVHFNPFFSREKLEKFFKEPHSYVEEGARCAASWFFLQVLADGAAIVYTRCHSKPVGNVNTTSVREIWNGPDMRRWRDFIQREGKMPMCRRCDLSY